MNLDRLLGKSRMVIRNVFGLTNYLEVLMLLERKFLSIVRWTPSEIQANSYPCEREDEIKDDFITQETAWLQSYLSIVAYKPSVCLGTRNILTMNSFCCGGFFERPSVQWNADLLGCLRCEKQSWKWSWTLQTVEVNLHTAITFVVNSLELPVQKGLRELDFF